MKYISLGIVLPTLFFLLIDLYQVKVNEAQISDLLFWFLWLILAAPLTFIGVRKLYGKVFVSIFITILIVFVIALMDIVLGLNFHFWIGGTK